MLVFPPDIESQRPSDRARGNSRNRIEAFPVGPSVVIDDGLAEVIAVAERRARNRGHTSVNRFDLCADVAGAVDAPALVNKLAGQGAIESDRLSDRLRRVRFLLLECLARLLDQARTFHSRPGPHARHAAL